MGTKGGVLAKQFEARVQEALRVIEGLSDADWSKVTETEQWTVGATAHHLATAFGAIAGMVAAVASGRSLGNLTGEMLDQRNATHAKEYAQCSKQETIALLEKNSATVAAVIRCLTDEQLARHGTVLTDAPPMSAEQFILGALIGHTDEHVGSIRKAVGAGRGTEVSRLA